MGQNSQGDSGIKALRSLAAEYRLSAERAEPEAARFFHDIADLLDREARTKIAIAMVLAILAGSLICFATYDLLALLTG